jgi:hypothetical protein
MVSCAHLRRRNSYISQLPVSGKKHFTVQHYKQRWNLVHKTTLNIPTAYVVTSYITWPSGCYCNSSPECTSVVVVLSLVMSFTKLPLFGRSFPSLHLKSKLQKEIIALQIPLFNINCQVSWFQCYFGFFRINCYNVLHDLCGLPCDMFKRCPASEVSIRHVFTVHRGIQCHAK